MDPVILDRIAQALKGSPFRARCKWKRAVLISHDGGATITVHSRSDYTVAGSPAEVWRHNVLAGQALIFDVATQAFSVIELANELRALVA